MDPVCRNEWWDVSRDRFRKKNTHRERESLGHHHWTYVVSRITRVWNWRHSDITHISELIKVKSAWLNLFMPRAQCRESERDKPVVFVALHQKLVHLSEMVSVQHELITGTVYTQKQKRCRQAPKIHHRSNIKVVYLTTKTKNVSAQVK